MQHRPFAPPTLRRRDFLRLAGGVAAGALAPVFADGQAVHRRVVPASGERLPCVGMGTWITFNVGGSEGLRAARLAVARAFFELGGGMIDSSPMYGSSEAVVGHCLEALGRPASLFSATKVWTRGGEAGLKQIEASRQHWGEAVLDLVQVHNLVDWRTQLDTLRALKASGRIRYLGITTSHGLRHEEFADICRKVRPDFAQFTYNILDRGAERELLPLAADLGIAVIVNRPFRGGRLFDAYGDQPLPGFAAEIGCPDWASYFLKFILSHPAVTCVIPATTRVEHLRENMRGGTGPLPDAAARERMAAHLAAL